MAVFLESPWPILTIGVVAEIILAIILAYNRRGILLWAMLGAAAFTALGVLVEYLVVTDREAISDLLYAGARSAEANDVDRLLGSISPASKQTRNDIREAMTRAELQMVRILDLEIEVDRKAAPRTGKATFRVFGVARDRRGEFLIQNFSGDVVVYFRVEDGRWLVRGYKAEQHNPK